MKKKERLIGIIMAVVISTVMGALASFIVRKNMNPQALAATPAAAMYIANIVESIVVGVIIVLLLPFGKWGKALTVKFHAAPPGLKFTALNCLPISLGSAILVSAIVSLINIAQVHANIPAGMAPPMMVMWVSQWLGMLPASIIVSYIMAVIVSPFVVQAVGMPTGGPPPAAGGPQGN